jgi:hypothetical protein
MQTFLTARSFSETALTLDSRRLNKQVVEAYQILNANDQYERHRTLHGPFDMTYRIGWVNHPCNKMWRGYSHLLAVYSLAMIRECKARGIRQTMADRFEPFLSRPFVIPPWIANGEVDKVIESHRASLYRKDPTFYSQFANTPDIPLHWPVQ